MELRLNVLIFFLRFEAENVLKMFLNYMVYTTCISVNQCRRDQETYQSALPAEIWYLGLLIMTNRDVCHHYVTMPLSILVILHFTLVDFIYRLTK